MAKNDLEDRLKAQAEHEQQPADETIAKGEQFDLEVMDAAVEAESRAGAVMPTGYNPSGSLQNPNLAEELQGMELKPKTFGPPQYGSPDPASAASRLMTLEDGHPLAGLEEGTAAISEDYGAAYGGEVEASDAARELAESESVDLRAVEGTGKDGQITKGDVEKYVKDNKADEG